MKSFAQQLEDTWEKVARKLEIKESSSYWDRSSQGVYRFCILVKLSTTSEWSFSVDIPVILLVHADDVAALMTKHVKERLKEKAAAFGTKEVERG